MSSYQTPPSSTTHFPKASDDQARNEQDWSIAFVQSCLKYYHRPLGFCGKHCTTSDIEMVKIHDINEADERMLKSDVKYRFVIDMASLKA